MSYRLQTNGVKRLSDNAFIPDAPGNRDWQEYQEWLAEGNAPEPQFTTEEIRLQKHRDIEMVREAKIAQGYKHTFPDTGAEGTVQLRNQVDIRNVSGLGSASTALILLNQTPPMEFTDAENIVHSLSPSEILDMCLKAQTHISGLYIKARTKKDELAATPDPANYDVEVGW